MTYVACKMTVAMVKFESHDFIDGVTIKAAEDFLKQDVDCKILLYYRWGGDRDVGRPALET